jgi:hypothetical protein
VTEHPSCCAEHITGEIFGMQPLHDDDDDGAGQFVVEARDQRLRKPLVGSVSGRFGIC